MKVALIGASGNAGSCIQDELVKRGHQVTAIARNVSRIKKAAGVLPLAVDANNEAELTGILKGHDAVISAVMFTSSNPEILISAVKKAGIRRYLVVGGAGSLEVAPGVRVIDTPDFPAEYKPEASAGALFLERLQREPALDWTFLSPSAEFVHGPRTGAFRLGEDSLLVDQKGRSHISFEDYAIAMVDELEQGRHLRNRFTVGY